GCRPPRRSRPGPRRRSRRDARCTGSGRTPCSRSRCAAARRTRSPAAPAASRPGGDTRCGRPPRTTVRFEDQSRQFSFPGTNDLLSGTPWTLPGASAHAFDACRSWRPTVYLMRTGAPGAEKPAARVDGERYVDLSDVVTDFDEAFFAGGGIERVRGIVDARAAAGQVAPLGDEPVGAPIARPPP